jgi:acyl-CoA dehydrogenase
MDIEMARLLCLKAAWMMDQGDPVAAAPWISQIKVAAPKIALRIADEAVQMHGAAGISQDTPLARSWTHLRTLRLADGPTPCTAARSPASNCASTRRRKCDEEP